MPSVGISPCSYIVLPLLLYGFFLATDYNKPYLCTIESINSKFNHKKITTMKKLYTMMLIATMAFTFTSCEDESIADSLEGTWSGNMYVSSYYDGRDFFATHTEITFNIDPFRFTKGSGYWVDYYSGAPWDYVANHIDWSVDNGKIYVYFVEDGSSVVIADYHLSNSRFTGYIADGDYDVHFDLMHISSPNWNNYNNWGYDDWFDSYYYYARQTRADGSAAIPVEKPVRQFGKKAE